MLRDALSKFATILLKTGNPGPLLLDYLGLQHRPYRVIVRDSVVLELRPQMGDRFGFYEVALRDDYFRGGQSLQPGDTIIDVGANIGCFSLLAAQRVGPTGRVIALEPEAATFAQLQRNIALNGAANVVARRVAIGEHVGPVALYTSRASSLFSSVYKPAASDPAPAGAQPVQMITLSELMQDESITRCHYLKLDCEGAEHDIVASMTPDVANRIDQITLELHKIAGKDALLIPQRLGHLGFSLVTNRGLHYYRRPHAPPSPGRAPVLD